MMVLETSDVNSPEPLFRTATPQAEKEGQS